MFYIIIISLFAVTLNYWFMFYSITYVFVQINKFKFNLGYRITHPLPYIRQLRKMVERERVPSADKLRTRLLRRHYGPQTEGLRTRTWEGKFFLFTDRIRFFFGLRVHANNILKWDLILKNLRNYEENTSLFTPDLRTILLIEYYIHCTKRLM